MDTKLNKRTASLGPDGKLRGDVIVALACSTGGPKALQEVIPAISGSLNAPIIITQHMPRGFTKAMADRLDSLSQLQVHEAEEGQVLENGHVYIAPGGYHLVVGLNAKRQPVCKLNDDPPIGKLKPCADVMYDSLTKAKYSTVLCVVLTGMGEDGTKGIKNLGTAKDIYVVSQEKSSCVVYGMPKGIENAGYSDEVVELTKIAATIEKRVGVK